MPEQKDIDFKWLFSKKEEEGKRLFSLPSFAASDTDVLQSFSSLDPRIKQGLAISFDVQVKFLKQIYWSFVEEVTDYKQAHTQLQQFMPISKYMFRYKGKHFLK